MSENRVIGAAGQIPWHLPEDFKWFKQVTMGHVLVMGRKTFESIGRPLPGRTTVVLTHQNWHHPGVTTAADFAEVDRNFPDREIFLAGGGEIYRQALPRCAEIYLTIVKRSVAGDAYFPEVADLFTRETILREEPLFRIEHWKRKP